MILKVSCKIDKDDIENMLKISAAKLENMSPEFKVIYNACMEIYKINDHTFMQFVYPIEIEELDLGAAKELRSVLS